MPKIKDRRRGEWVALPAKRSPRAKPPTETQLEALEASQFKRGGTVEGELSRPIALRLPVETLAALQAAYPPDDRGRYTDLVGAIRDLVVAHADALPGK